MLPFADRMEAGRLLAAKLKSYAGKADVIVVVLPRGGVPVGSEIARRLNAPLEVLVVRKLGVPWQPELAMGAVASGARSCSDPVSELVEPLYLRPNRKRRGRGRQTGSRVSRWLSRAKPIWPNGHFGRRCSRHWFHDARRRGSCPATASERNHDRRPCSITRCLCHLRG